MSPFHLFKNICSLRFRFFVILFLLFCSSHVAGGQKTIMDGTFWLRSHRTEIEAKTRALIATDKSYAKQLLKTGNILSNMIPGTTNQSFQCYNFGRGQYEPRTATLQAAGQHCYIFVADDSISLLGTDAAATIGKVRDTFDQKIYRSDIDWFGNLILPDFGLPDDKVYILLLDIRDGLGSGYVAGYFDSRDLEGDQGNRKPLFFMDLNPGTVGEPTDKTNDFFRTLAHEFQHMINFSHHLPQSGRTQEERWLDEGLAQFAEYQYTKLVNNDGIGLPPSPHLAEFLAAPNIVLTNNSDTDWFSSGTLFRQYGASFLFMYYVAETLAGSDDAARKTLIRSIVDNPLTGCAGLDKVFAAYGTNFVEVVKNWTIANHLNDVTLNNGKWGYVDKTNRLGKEADGLPIAGRSHVFHGSGASSLGGQGQTSSNVGTYEDISGSGNLSLRFQGPSTGMTPFVAVVPKSGSAFLQDIALDSNGAGSINLDLSAAQKVVLVPAAFSATSDVKTTFSYSFSNQGGSVVLYPLPNPVVPDHFFIVLKSLGGSIADTPSVNVTFGGQQSSLSMSPTDSTRQTFMTGFKIPGAGTGVVSVSTTSGTSSFSFSGSVRALNSN